MVIPMPCKFGESADCKGIVRPLSGVSWFKWSWGMEYTYFFETGNKWRITDFYCTRETEQSFEMDIPDSLLVDKPAKEHGFPLRGTGYACGVDYKDGKTYIDFIMTSIYLSHVKTQCDENWKYERNGYIILPPSWDTEEKKNRVVMKRCVQKSDLEKAKKKPFGECQQMTVFDFIGI